MPAASQQDEPEEVAEGGHDIRYARSGDVNIADEVTGGGPIDVVLVAGFVSHLELDWEDPGRRRSWTDSAASAG